MKHKDLNAALSWVKANGNLTESSILIPPSGVNVGDTINCTCTGAVHTSETRRSREDRKTNPQFKPTFYVAYEYKSDKVGEFNSLTKGEAGQKYQVTVGESAQINPNTNQPYVELQFSAVKAEKPQRVKA